MAVTVIADLTIKPDEVNWVIATLRRALPSTRMAEGCSHAELHQSQDEPNNLIIVQEFASREHYHAYMASVSDQEDPGVLARYGASFQHPANVRFFDHIHS